MAEIYDDERPCIHCGVPQSEHAGNQSVYCVEGTVFYEPRPSPGATAGDETSLTPTRSGFPGEGKSDALINGRGVNRDENSPGDASALAPLGERPDDPPDVEGLQLIVDDYAAAARVTHQDLAEFCDESKRFPDMVADASRKAAAEITALRASLQAARDENSALRRLLWIRHHDTTEGLYGDDGELQCNRCVIDFKRDPVESIERRFIAINHPALDALLAAARHPGGSQ